MPGTVHSIIVGGGVQVGIPSTDGNIPQFAGGPPPDTLIDSILREVVGPPQSIIVGTVDPSSGAAETFRTRGGIISEGAGTDSLVLGQAAAVGANGGSNVGSGIALGANASVGTNLNDSVLVGAGSFLSSPALATGGFPGAIVAFGPRINVVASQGQPYNYVTALGQGINLTTTIGGTIGNVIAIGSFISMDAPNDIVCVGSSLAAPAQYSGSVHLGNSHVVGAAGIGNVMIGSGVQTAGGSDNILIGRGARKIGAPGGDQNIVVGVLAVAQNADYSVVIGAISQVVGVTGCIAIGRQSNIQFHDCLAIGPGATPTAPNQAVIGSDFTGGNYQEFILGRGPFVGAGNVFDVTIHTSDISNGQNNLSGANLYLRGGLSTGNATPSIVGFFSSIPGGSSGTAQTPMFAGYIWNRGLVLAPGTGQEIRIGDTNVVAVPSLYAGVGGGSTALMQLVASTINVLDMAQSNFMFKIQTDPSLIGAGAANFSIWDKGSSTLYVVQIGAPNSGGAGQRLLTIGN